MVLVIYQMTRERSSHEGRSKITLSSVMKDLMIGFASTHDGRKGKNGEGE